MLNGQAAAKINSNAYDEDFDIQDDWGDEWGEESDEKKKFEDFDYQNTNLNKLNDKELQKHKQSMDKDFSKNQLKPGD